MIGYIIYNIVNLGCFTTLAIVFDKWWIIFFALLFVTTPKVMFKHRRKCDGCGVQSEYADSVDEAIKKSVKSGWVHIPEGNKDYCPNCVKKFKESGTS
jgi:hypothetical protein